MKLIRGRRGFTLIEMGVALTMLGVLMAMVVPLSRRIIARYELNSAAQTLSSDLAHAKIRAIQSNSITVLRRETLRAYRVADHPRRLPDMVRFDEASVDSLRFDGLGATLDGGLHLLLLENHFGDRVEVRVYASGGHEVRRL